MVLVGHAYSGAVIAAVREERVKSLVYIAALAPDEGETVAEVFYREPAHPEAPKLAPDSHGFIWMPDDGFQRAVAHKASADQTRIARAVQQPIALQCIQEPVLAPAWRAKPSWFLIAEEDRMISPKTQHFMADRMGAQAQSHCVDHSPMYTEPESGRLASFWKLRRALSHNRVNMASLSVEVPGCETSYFSKRQAVEISRILFRRRKVPGARREQWNVVTFLALSQLHLSAFSPRAL